MKTLVASVKEMWRSVRQQVLISLAIVFQLRVCRLAKKSFIHDHRGQRISGEEVSAWLKEFVSYRLHWASNRTWNVAIRDFGEHSLSDYPENRSKPVDSETFQASPQEQYKHD